MSVIIEYRGKHEPKYMAWLSKEELEDFHKWYLMQKEKIDKRGDDGGSIFDFKEYSE